MEFIRVMLEQFIAEQRERNRRADHALATILNEQRHIKELIMGNQDTINAESGKLDTLITNQKTLITTTSDLVDEVKALKDAAANGETLDFTAIDQKLADAEAAVDTANASFPDPGPQGGTAAAKAQ